MGLDEFFNILERLAKTPISTRTFLKGSAAAAVAAIVPSCSSKEDDSTQPQPTPVTPTYFNPIVIPGQTTLEANTLPNHAFISKQYFEQFYLPYIGSLPTVNNNPLVTNHVTSTVNPALQSAGTILGYSPNMRLDALFPIDQGGLWGIINLSSATATLLPANHPFTDSYTANGAGQDGTIDSAELFTSTTIDSLVREFFNTDVTQRTYPAGHSEYDYTLNTVSDVFLKYGDIKSKPQIKNIQSGPVTIVNQDLVAAGYTNGVEFDADAYVTWTDSQNNERTLIVRLDSNKPGSKFLSNDERTAIQLMDGKDYYQNILHINLSDITGLNNSLTSNLVNLNWNWKSTSEGGIRYAQLAMLDRMNK